MKKQTPLKQIKLYCFHSCMNHQSVEVKYCPSKNCIFYNMRYGKNESNPHIRALKQIKEYCKDCSDGSYNIKKCQFTYCELFQFKLGKNPFSTRKGNITNIRLKSILPLNSC
jgi:hypothetical protein